MRISILLFYWPGFWYNDRAVGKNTMDYKLKNPKEKTILR